MEKACIDLNNKTVLVTGSPGFIGANLVRRLRREMTSGTVVSLDNLNDYYVGQFGDFTRGTVAFSIPRLEAGPHSLTFRAWDVLNNTSLTSLDFVVNPSLKPDMLALTATQNPAITSTTFVVSYDFPGADCTFTLDVFDFSGRCVWTKTEVGSSPTGQYRIPWNLSTGAGGRLGSGIYLYRCTIQCGSSKKVSKTQKIVVLNNK